MSQSESGVGAVIIAVIVIGAGWVCFGMMHESEPTGPTMPDVSILGKQSKQFLSARPKDNPYVDALLMPRSESGRVGEGERFSRMIKKYLGEPESEHSVDGASSPRGADQGDNARVGQMLNNISSLSAGEQTGPALTAVREAMAYADNHAGVSGQKRVDLTLIAGQLSYRERDYDQSRQFVSRGIAIAHQSRDYKMDDLEGLRCVLNGNESEATKYNLTLSDFNSTEDKENYSQLPKLADDMIAETASLPEESYFRLQAQLAKAKSMIDTTENKDDIRAYLKKVEVQAKKAQDQDIAAHCAALLAKL